MAVSRGKTPNGRGALFYGGPQITPYAEEVTIVDEAGNPVSGGAWAYAAAASGIVNTTTAVTVKAASGAGVKNYIDGVTIATATLGGATEFVIRDGAAGTVLFRTLLNTTALPTTTIAFSPPLRGTANTLVEVATLTAVTGGVYVNVRGHTGA